jgi:ubiquinone/menaquinone biosynthesis C-methylase UbiE
MENAYLMESGEEGHRLDLKTRPDDVVVQACWAGITAGMHVLDVGCGVGKTTSILKEVVGATGTVTGLDFSASRLADARRRYGRQGIRFMQHDMRQPFEPEAQFDAIWMRFLLEYFRDDPLSIVRNVTRRLKPGGILCLIDLDHNCLNHHGHSDRLERTIREVLRCLEVNHNFDPYAGRRLYAHLIDLSCQEIRIEAGAHHLFFGALEGKDAYNWMRKIDVAAQHSGCDFAEYGGDYQAAREDFQNFLTDPRRFTYTPIIMARGIFPPHGKTP